MNAIDIESFLKLNLKQNDKWLDQHNITASLIEKCAERCRDRKNFVHSVIEENNEMLQKLKCKPQSSSTNKPSTVEPQSKQIRRSC